MKRTLLPIIMLLYAGTLFCQAQDTRRWSEGIPDWSGFRITEAADSASSFASFTLLKDKKTVRTNGIVYRYMDVTGALLPYMSWVRSDSMNDIELASIRRDFDILEYYARAFREELLFVSDRNGELERKYIKLFRDAQSEAHASGDYTRYALQREPFDISQVSYVTSGRDHGVSVGLFTNLPLGDQGRLVYPTPGVALAFDLGRGPGRFLAEINVGASPFRRHYQGIRRKFVPYASLFVFYRRVVSRLDRWRFSLYGGPGYSLRDYQEDNFKTMVGGPSASEGVCADFFLGRSVSFTSSHPEQTDRFLQVKLSCNQLFNAKQGKIVPSINLSAGLWFQSSDIKRK